MHALDAPLAFALQTPDWQTNAPVATVHGPLPFGVPHWPFAPQTFATHSAAKTHAALFAAAQVFVTALHWPETQTFSASAVAHTPSWRPSFGSARPATLSATHLSVVRSQWSAAAQSLSTKQPPVAGMQVFAPKLQAPDWQRYAVSCVQPEPPSAMPQRPFWQELNWHSLGAVHARPTTPAQVFVVVLHVPLAHTTAATAFVQTPFRRPSLGIGAPSARSVRHVSDARSQYWLPSQSPSAQQPAPPGGTQRPLDAQVFETHWVLAVQSAVSALPQVFAAALQRPVVHAAFSAFAGQVWWSPSDGSEVPDASFAVQVYVLRAQNSPWPQSASMKHELACGTQRPEREQWFDWHSPESWQAASSARPQVFVAGLQAPATQTASAVAGVQVPPWRPSFGIVEPAGSFARQVNVFRSQYWLPEQSASAKQAPARGTHAPLEAHTLLVHWAAAVQLVPLVTPQVLSAALQRPLAHTARAVCTLHVPSWRPSFGITAPAATFAVHANVARSQ